MTWMKWAFAAIAALAIVAFSYIRTTRNARQANTEGPVIRTVPVVFGDLNQTVRITGTISAEHFAAIIAPRLRGSRGDRGE